MLAVVQEMFRRLLAEQNAEYEASLAADREREARRQEEQRKVEEEAKQAAMEEAKARYAGPALASCIGLGLHALFACLSSCYFKLRRSCCVAI